MFGSLFIFIHIAGSMFALGSLVNVLNRDVKVPGVMAEME
jgi:hypothetical protein